MTRKRAAGSDPDSSRDPAETSTRSEEVLPEEERDEETPPTGQETGPSEDLPEDQAAQEPDAGSTG